MDRYYQQAADCLYVGIKLFNCLPQHLATSIYSVGVSADKGHAAKKHFRRVLPLSGKVFCLAPS